jgi:hypothetical protein
VETIEYAHRFDYVRISGEPFPILQLRLFNPSRPDRGLDVDAYLDSGAQGSLFNGWRAQALGLDLLSGPRKLYGPIAGPNIEARLHRVRLSHPILGKFDLEIGFSTVEIRREIVGRDFFNCIQIGFRERYLTYYITPIP